SSWYVGAADIRVSELTNLTERVCLLKSRSAARDPYYSDQNGRAAISIQKLVRFPPRRPRVRGNDRDPSLPFGVSENSHHSLNSALRSGSGCAQLLPNSARSFFWSAAKRGQLCQVSGSWTSWTKGVGLPALMSMRSSMTSANPPRKSSTPWLI